MLGKLHESLWLAVKKQMLLNREQTRGTLLINIWLDWLNDVKMATEKEMRCNT